jgi:hypothetical protein
MKLPKLENALLLAIRRGRIPFTFPPGPDPVDHRRRQQNCQRETSHDAEVLTHL